MSVDERVFEPNRNEKVLGDFERYCAAHPDERFWQALRNWSGVGFLYASSFGPFVLGGASKLLHDTFGWEGKEAPAREEKKGL